MLERGAKKASLLTWKSIRAPSLLGASTQCFTAIHTHQPVRVQTPLLMQITRNPELGQPAQHMHDTPHTRSEPKDAKFQLQFVVCLCFSKNKKAAAANMTLNLHLKVLNIKH